MNFHILTLFPEMVMQTLSTSITGRALRAGTITIEAVNIRDFSQDKHKKTDDYPYGGGAGMLMQAQPVYDAYEHAASAIPAGRKKRVIYVTPQGTPFHQRLAEELAECEDLIFLCGHYEGVDERVLEEIVTDYISIGDYVLTGGELAAMVMVDAIARLVPGVLHNGESAATESFHQYLLEYPQYSRPEVWHDKAVPEVLLSGNPKEVAAWRLAQSIERTKARRPELYAKYDRLAECRSFLMKEKLLCADMIAAIDRGSAELICWNQEEVLLYDFRNRVHALYVGMPCPKKLIKNGRALPSLAVFSAWIRDSLFCMEKVLIHQKDAAWDLAGLLGKQKGGRITEFYHAVYTRKEQLPVSGLYRTDGQENEQGLLLRPLAPEELEAFWTKKRQEEFSREVTGECKTAAGGDAAAECKTAAGGGEPAGVEELRKCALCGNLAGAWLHGEPAGIAGIFSDGRIGLLTVFPEYRRKHIGKALETYMINRCLQQGFLPYGRITPENTPGIRMQESLGLYLSKKTVAFFERL